MFARMVVGSATSKLEHLAIHMNNFGAEAGAAFAERIPLVAGGGGGDALTELFLNSNALGAEALSLLGKRLLVGTHSVEGSGMALLNLQDNGPSEVEAKRMMRGVECVETLLL